ncbi:MAG: 2-hydroxyacyl-CoA dehydratase family protein [Bacteroidota bacterium]|jgi:benzoyl-CoA reductase subunit C
MKTLSEIHNYCKNTVLDNNFTAAKKWKEQASNRVLIGMIPNFFPREIIHAANGLAVGIVGEEFKMPQNTKPDMSSHQACSMFSGILELVNNGNLEGFDGFLLPSQCHTLQVLEEISKISDKCKFIKYINFPQYFHTIIGDILNHYFVQDILDEIYKINGVKVDSELLGNSISLYKNNLKLTEKLFSLSKKFPENFSQEELYTTVFSGLVLPIEEHNLILKDAVEILMEGSFEKDDYIFTAYKGTYC